MIMKRITTTKKINEAIASNLVQIQKAEVYYKTSSKTETIDADKIKENFDFLCEAGIFTDCVGWYFEKNPETGNYEIETGRTNPTSEIIVTVYLGACGDDGEKVDMVLSVEEE